MVLVVIPTYNEARTIAALVEALLGCGEEYRVLVVDDGSPDGTAAIARATAEGSGRVDVVERTGRRGYGAASREGLGFPPAPLCAGDVLVEKPIAPARIASRTIVFIAPISSAVALRSVAASPIT